MAAAASEGVEETALLLQFLEGREPRTHPLHDLVDRPDLVIVPVESHVQGRPGRGVAYGASRRIAVIERMDVAIEVDVRRLHRAMMLAVPGEHRIMIQRHLDALDLDLDLVV